MKQGQVYCSLDIEASGFDAAKNEIIELGFVFFKLSENGAEVVEEWTRVFKPAQKVAPRILGLTGISRQELDEAQPLREYRDFLQDKLGSAVLVGHSVGVDIKFLESFGISCRGGFVDTLDLVQFLLPTHHSYNLESLMHLFDVPHREAHRALADAKATMTLLIKLLGVYQNFTEALKAQIVKVAVQYKLPFAGLFEVKVPKIVFKDSHVIQQDAYEWPQAEGPQPGVLYRVPAAMTAAAAFCRKAKSENLPSVLVLPRYHQVMQLWRQGLAHPIFPPQQRFDRQKMDTLLKRTDLAPDEARFALKILVWLHINWQTDFLVDLNLSFFGSQFKSLVVGGQEGKEDQDLILCTDQATFISHTEKEKFANRMLCVAGLAELEQNISFGIGQKASWGHISYLLRMFYNPENPDVNLQYKNAVLDLLNASDLFFGLSNALLQSLAPNSTVVKVSEPLLYAQNYQKIKAASEHYVKKLRVGNNSLHSEDIEHFAANVEQFFIEEPNAVKWIETGESRCVLYSCPLEIKELVSSCLLPFERVCLFDYLPVKIVSPYFISRLGVTDFKPVSLYLSKKSNDQRQAEESAANSSCVFKPGVLPLARVPEMLGPDKLPAAVIFPSPALAKEFYDSNFGKLQEYAFLFNQSSSGGSNKLYRNFTIHQNSLLITLSQQILRYLQQGQSAQPVDYLPVKTLILGHLPFQQLNLPYEEALSARFKDPFLEFVLPKTLYNLHLLLGFFATPKLEEVIIFESKLPSNLKAAVVDYLKTLNFREITE